MSKTVSAIVLSYGAEPWLEDCIESIHESEGVSVEVILVDNGCTDGAVERIERKFRAQVLRPETNLGFTGGCNLGAGASSGDPIVFINSDAIVDPQALSSLSNAFDDPDVGIAGASIRLSSDPATINSAGNPLHFLGFSWAGGYGEPALHHDKPREIAIASGACMAVRRDLWKELDGFDTAYFGYHEDTELCIRCWHLGRKVVYVPDAVVIHRYEFARQAEKFFQLERNRVMLVLTLYEFRTLALILPVLLLTEIALIFVAASQGWLKHKIRSWGWLIRNMHSIIRRRQEWKNKRTSHDSNLVSMLVPRFDAKNFPLPSIAKPFDSFLGAYWRVVRHILKGDGKDQ